MHLFLFKNWEISEVSKLIKKNFRIRKENKKNPLLKEIQSKWIE